VATGDVGYHIIHEPWNRCLEMALDIHAVRGEAYRKIAV